MKRVKYGVVGLGGMGQAHLRLLLRHEEVEVVGVSDMNPQTLEAICNEHGVAGYATHTELLEKSGAEAIVIATPHPFHAPIAIDAANNGVHVLCEKPIAVSVSEADAMIEACKKAGVLLGVGFQFRMNEAFQKAKEMIGNDIIGDIYEVEMISTDWYRRQSYYDAADWRGTWKGEGGGILANQTPHNLDILAWLAGMPTKVKATVQTRLHNIETENTVHAIFEYSDESIGYFRATTTDPIGDDRIEIHGSKGRLLVRQNSLQLGTYTVSIPDHLLGATDEKIDLQWEDVVVDGARGTHEGVTDNFTRAIKYGDPLLATGEEGRNALELANAMHLSGLRRREVSLPLDRAEVDELFDELRRS